METWSSRLGVGRGADNPTPEKNYCHETLRRLKPTPGCNAKEEEEEEEG